VGSENSQVLTVGGALAAYRDAWFYSRVFWYEIGLSVSSGQNRQGIQTGYWFGKPDPRHGNPEDPELGMRWASRADRCGTFLQDFVSGVGARRLWFDYTDETGLLRPARGPFGIPTMLDYFKKALLEHTLSQKKGRLAGQFTKNGENLGRLLIRVPHR